MNLIEAISYTEDKVNNHGFKSDGCTFAPDLGIVKFCEMHDCLRAFKPVSTAESDKLFFEGICTKGIRYYPIAIVYFIAVRLQGLVGWAGVSIIAILLTIPILLYIQPK